MAVNRVFSNPHYYQGLSTDTKPTDGVPVGSLFYETDTGKKYEFRGAAGWIDITSQLTSVSGSKTQVGTDQAAAFANSAAANTQVNVDFACPDSTRPRYKIAVYNPSTVTDLTVKVFEKVLDLGGATRYNLIDTITVPKSQAITGTTVESYAKFIEGIFNGAALRLVVSNNTVLGAADGFSAYIRIREAG